MRARANDVNPWLWRMKMLFVSQYHLSMFGTSGLSMSVWLGTVDSSYHSKSASDRLNEFSFDTRWSMAVSQMVSDCPGSTGWSVPLPGIT